MSLNHKEGLMHIGGDMSRNNVDSIFVKNITKGSKEARFLGGADTKMSVATADTQNKVGGSPSLEGGGWRWQREITKNIFGGDRGGKMRK